MDMSRRDQVLLDVPFEIRNAVKPLNNDTAWALYITILKRNDIRYTDIKEELGIDSSGYINRYLKLLIAAGLIERRAKYLKDFGSAEKIYYRPTPMGKSLIKGLFENVMIQSPVEKRRVAFTNTSKAYSFKNKEIGNESRYVARYMGDLLE
jgi:predicted transcriptional regulator